MNAICRAIKRSKAGNLSNDIRTGRPSKLTRRDESFLAREVKKDPFIASRELSERTFIVQNCPLSAPSIRRILLKLKLRSYVSKKKPLITPSMAKKRLAWCKKYVKKDPGFWQKVIFSDETEIFIRSNALMQRCRRFPWDSPYNRRFIRPTVKHPLSVMVWGCFSMNYRPDLYFVNGYMNSAGYKEVLDKFINRDAVKNMGLIFQDDSAPCHRSSLIKTYKTENEIQSLDWPGNSPDLNPIENLWNLMKRKVGRNRIMNSKDLKDKINEAWKSSITPEIIKELIDSMPKRIKQCIKAKGYQTKY